MKKNIIVFNLVLLGIIPCSCHPQFLKVLRESENQTFKLNYLDKDNNYYKRGLIAGNSVNVLFTKTELIDSNKFLVEGLTIVPALKDTVGFCCVEIFLAQTLGDSLYNIRPLGESNSIDLNPNERDGFFSFEALVLPGDRLFFCGDRGSRLREFFIDRLLSISKH